MTATTAPATIADVEDAYYGVTVTPSNIGRQDLVGIAAHVGPNDDPETRVGVTVDRAALLAALIPDDVREYLRALVNVDEGENAPEGVDPAQVWALLAS